MDVVRGAVTNGWEGHLHLLPLTTGLGDADTLSVKKYYI